MHFQPVATFVKICIFNDEKQNIKLGEVSVIIKQNEWGRMNTD